MAYDLSFSEDFFLDRPEEEINASPRPTCVYQAIKSISDELWQEIAREVFGIDSDYLDCWMVMDRICETNTCTDLCAPVEVWIDEEGFYTIDVYESLER